MSQRAAGRQQQIGFGPAARLDDHHEDDQQRRRDHAGQRVSRHARMDDTGLDDGRFADGAKTGG
jgi:hypothetical protein